MKKILSVLLTVAILASFCACQQDTSKTESSETMSIDDNGVITKTLSVAKLDTHIEGTKVRDREVKEGTRMLINSENPMFLFRSSLPHLGGLQSTIVSSYKVLPEDLRAFSAVLADQGVDGSIDDLLSTWEKMLKQTDKENIPIFLMVENWDSVNSRRGFTYEELCDLLERHPSLMGYVVVEQACSPFRQEHVDRAKTIIQACKEYDALFIWQEMGYNWDGEDNFLERMLEDKELYDLMTGYSHNIVITDKHSGRGRHFSTQSNVFGAYLSGVCDNWGSNIEAWLWGEIVPLDYSSTAPTYQSYMGPVYRYPPALAGIDTIGDVVGGATVFSTEEIFPFYTTMSGVKLTETFWSVLYPLYQHIINGALPDKEEVKENVKVAYQYTAPNDLYTTGVEADLFVDTYGITRQWYTLWSGGEYSKKWVPMTGRYYIIPSIPRYANAAEVLTNVDILNVDNYEELFGSSEKRQAYLNERYPETYTGDATLYSVNGFTYIYNNNEFQPNAQTANYSLKSSGLELSTKLDIHTYMLLEDKADSVDIKVTNLRLDTYEAASETETFSSFIKSYLKGGKMDNEEDFRTTTISLTGLEKMPEVKVAGNNNPTAEVKFDPNTKTATITIVSNGTVTLNVVK